METVLCSLFNKIQYRYNRRTWKDLNYYDMCAISSELIVL